MSRTRLDSWKSIAEYLERSIRTVQRWQTEHQLPIHQLPGPKGAVYAYPGELDSWLAGSQGQSGNGPSLKDKAVTARKSRSLSLISGASEMWEVRSEKNLPHIAKIYREAIEEYPNNTQAYLGLAQVNIVAALDGMVTGPMAYRRAQQALHKLYMLEPDSVARKCAVAWLDFAWFRKWQKAQAAFDEILKTKRQTYFALSGRALLAVAEGNLKEAFRYALEAWNQNPLVQPLHALLCWIKYLDGEFEQSLQLVSEAEIGGEYGAMHAAIEALARIQCRSISEDILHLENFSCDLPSDRALQGALGYFYAISNQTEKAFQKLENLGWTSTREPTNRAYGVALVLLGLDRQEEAIQSLEASFKVGSLWSLGFRTDPILKALRTHPRFRELCLKTGPRE